MNEITFNFQFGTTVIFGRNKIRVLKDLLKEYELSKPCFVIDSALKDNKFLNSEIEEFKNNKTIILNSFGEPTYEHLEQKRNEINNKNIDVFVGIGGGSTIDLTKGLSVLYTNKSNAIDYMGFNRFNNPIKPIIAVPTTAGSGSEITPNASFVDTKSKRKMGINGEKIRPILAILDPLLTLSCPLNPSIYSALDAIVHSTEAFVAKKSNFMAKLLAKKSLNIILSNIDSIYKDLNNIEVRESLLLGSFLAASALMNSGTGPAAAISYPLGVHFGVPHGLGGGISLPHVISKNIEKGFDEYDQIFNSNKKNSFIDKINKVWSEIKVPNNLNEFKINDNDLNLIVSETYDMKGAINQNPIDLTIEDISDICRNII